MNIDEKREPYYLLITNMDDIGDCHISFSWVKDLPPQAPLWIEIQKQVFWELNDEFGPQKNVIQEPVGELGGPERTRWVIKRTLEECVLLNHMTDFIILHGVEKWDSVLVLGQKRHSTTIEMLAGSEITSVGRGPWYR